MLQLTLPNWIPNPHAMFFYLLQHLSNTYLPPQYTVFKKSHSTSLHTPPNLSEVLKMLILPTDVHQEFLYTTCNKRKRYVYIKHVHVHVK